MITEEMINEAAVAAVLVLKDKAKSVEELELIGLLVANTIRQYFDQKEAIINEDD